MKRKVQLTSPAAIPAEALRIQRNRAHHAVSGLVDLAPTILHSLAKTPCMSQSEHGQINDGVDPLLDELRN